MGDRNHRLETATRTGSEQVGRMMECPIRHPVCPDVPLLSAQWAEHKVNSVVLLPEKVVKSRYSGTVDKNSGPRNQLASG